MNSPSLAKLAIRFGLGKFKFLGVTFGAQQQQLLLPVSRRMPTEERILEALIKAGLGFCVPVSTLLTAYRYDENLLKSASSR